MLPRLRSGGLRRNGARGRVPPRRRDRRASPGRLGNARLPGRRVESEARPLDAAAHPGELGESPDWLLKEILEEPEAAARALGNGGRLLKDLGTAKLGGLGMEPRELLGLERVVFFGMGSGLHAAMIGARLVENWARMPATALDASELRSSNPIVDAGPSTSR